MGVETIHVGIIGAGFRGLKTLATRIAESAAETGLQVSALCDNRPDRLREACPALQGKFRDSGIDCLPVGYGDWPSLLAADDLDLDAVMVTTPQCAHREAAIAALEAGKRVYVDKPLAHTLEDAAAIQAAERRLNSPVMVGFTRRYELPWRRAYELLRNGAIGELQMIILRDIIPFHTYFQRWHRRREWSGGALNDKSSHHCDVLNWFADSRVVRLSAVGGRRVFMPRDDAPERCLECDDASCPYRVGPTRRQSVSQEEMAIEGQDWLRAQTEFERVDTCVYLPGADINDHAMIQVSYENGVTGCLLVSFFGPRADDQETMELVGTSGRIMLTRHTGQLRLIRDYGNEEEVIDCRCDQFGGSHFGADAELVREFRAFCDGMAPAVSATGGFEATRMIMAAHDAIDGGGLSIDMTAYPGLNS